MTKQEILVAGYMTGYMEKTAEGKVLFPGAVTPKGNFSEGVLTGDAAKKKMAENRKKKEDAWLAQNPFKLPFDTTPKSEYQKSMEKMRSMWANDPNNPKNKKKAVSGSI